MRKVLFEYRKYDTYLSYCRFIATHEDGRNWETVINRPFKFGASFWNENPYSARVTRVSHKIALEHNAPDWVME